MSVDKPKNARRISLLDFAITEYMPGQQRAISRARAREAFAKCKAIYKALREILGRRPIVNDLNPQTLADLVKAKVETETFISLWRCAFAMEIVDMPLEFQGGGLRRTTKILDREPVAGTLWHICQAQYFPKRPKLRSEKTRLQYAYALESFKRYLGHDPTKDDLNEDSVTGWMQALLHTSLSAWTVREKVGRVLSLWNWLARRDRTLEFPTVEKPEAPDPTPVAFSEAQLKKLFQAPRDLWGPAVKINGVPAADWWVAWLAFVWSTGERFSAAMELRWDWIDFEAGKIVIPPSVRKGRKKHGVYDLWPEVAELLKKIRRPDDELVFAWPKTVASYYNHYTKLLKAAGLPCDRKRKTHALRVSHATWREVMGGDATKALMHGDRATTEKSYLDPRFTKKDDVKLFQPWTGPDAQAS